MTGDVALDVARHDQVSCYFIRSTQLCGDLQLITGGIKILRRETALTAPVWSTVSSGMCGTGSGRQVMIYCFTEAVRGEGLCVCV